MKKRIKIPLAAAATSFSLIGLLLTVGTLADLRTTDQVARLMSFDYVSFVDSLDVGGLNGIADDFFTGIGLLLVGAVLFTRFEKTATVGRMVAGVLFIFVAMAMIYACLHSRVGIKP